MRTEVFGDIGEMALVLQPRALLSQSQDLLNSEYLMTHRSRDMISSALPPDPHEHLQGRELQTSWVTTALAEVTRERLQHLQTLRIWSDNNLCLWLWLRHRLGVEVSLSRGEASSWEILSLWRSELEGAGGSGDGVGHGVEGEFARE